MNRYPKSEDRAAAASARPQSNIVDLYRYRRQRDLNQHETNINLKPSDTGGEDAGARNERVETREPE